MTKKFVSFGLLLKRERIKYRMTQRAFAEKLKVPYSSYKNWEMGLNLPSFERVDMLSKKLGNPALGSTYENLKMR